MATPVLVPLSVKNAYKAPGLKLSATSVTMSPNADTELRRRCKNKKDTLSAQNVAGLSAPVDSDFLVENFSVEDGRFTMKAKEGFKACKLTVRGQRKYGLWCNL